MSQIPPEVKQAAERTADAMSKSHVYAGIVTDAFVKDPMCAMQLGFALLMDKPIILIIDKETKVPERLVKMAQLIERVDVKNEAEMNRATASIQKFMGNIKR